MQQVVSFPDNIPFLRISGMAAMKFTAWLSMIKGAKITTWFIAINGVLITPFPAFAQCNSRVSLISFIS
jgi:hypothetical protein